MKPIQLILSKPFGQLPAGASRFWGNPDLPEGTGYPMYVDDEGDEYPYLFVCQINLEQVAPYDTAGRLPHKGLLAFFAKIDHYVGMFAATDQVQGHISRPDAVKVLWIENTENLREVVLVDDDDSPLAFEEMQIDCNLTPEPLSDDHFLLAAPTHREWETWDPPFEDWEILLQVDSFAGMDFNLNFMDCGVFDFLISPRDLRARRFDNVRGIVLST